MLTQAERAAARRTEKLQEIRSQVKNGSLTIRKMTPAERERYPQRAPQPPRGRRK
jgi:hypothetical protein